MLYRKIEKDIYKHFTSKSDKILKEKSGYSEYACGLCPIAYSALPQRPGGGWEASVP